MPTLTPRLALAAAAALLVTGCAVTPPAGVPTAATPATPDAVPSETAAATPPASSSAGPTPTGPTPTGPASTPPTSAAPSGPAAKATGRLVFFTKNLVSDALKGSCQARAGRPTITLTDPKNDFFETVALTVVLNDKRTKVVTVTGAFGEDSEGIVRKLTVGAAGERKGTGATLTTTGSGLRVNGRGQMHENGRATEVTPFILTATCTGRW